MKKICTVFIEPGCIACGRCQEIAPTVFEITDHARVKATADFGAHEKEIKEAARQCPVQVIKVHEV